MVGFEQSKYQGQFSPEGEEEEEGEKRRGGSTWRKGKKEEGVATARVAFLSKICRGPEELSTLSITLLYLMIAFAIFSGQ